MTQSDLLKVEVKSKQAIQDIQTRVEYYVNKSNFEVYDDISLKSAVSVKAEISKFISESDSLRLSITKPIRNWVDTFNKTVAGFLEPIEEAKNSLNQKIVAFEEAKKENQRREEARVQEIIASFLKPLENIPHSIEDCEEIKLQARKRFSELAEDDKKNANIIDACNKLLQVVSIKIQELQTKIQLEIEQQRLRDIEQLNNKMLLEQEKNRIALLRQEQELKRKQEEAERLALQERIEQAKEKQKQEKLAQQNISVKTGLREYIKHKVIDPAIVPRQYCEPSDKLINMAKKAGVTSIPGVKIWIEKK